MQVRIKARDHKVQTIKVKHKPQMIIMKMFLKEARYVPGVETTDITNWNAV